VKLFEHQDFDQAVIEAARHFEERGLRPALIEKDYYVTEALRKIAEAVGDKVIFKGGTSLSKGWNLIRRFSEDSTSSSTLKPSIQRWAGEASTER
jgi:predicted nucleotidyltransferase component of viral defense system